MRIRLRLILTIALSSTVTLPLACAEQPGRKKTDAKKTQQKAGVNPLNRDRRPPAKQGARARPVPAQ